MALRTGCQVKCECICSLVAIELNPKMTALSVPAFVAHAVDTVSSMSVALLLCSSLLLSPCMRRRDIDCISNIEGFGMAVNFAIATQQTIGVFHCLEACQILASNAERGWSHCHMPVL